MEARLRRGGRAAAVAVVVVMSLVGTALLAYATTQPPGGVYPAKGAVVRGTGFAQPCVAPPASPRAKGNGLAADAPGRCSFFNFDVRRTVAGRVEGLLVLHCEGADRKVFQFKEFSSLVISGDTASFSAVGRSLGPPSTRGTVTAEVTVSDAPDTFSATVRSGAEVVCQVTGITGNNSHISIMG